MTVTVHVRAHLLANMALTDLIGQRAHAVMAPKGSEYPYLVLIEIFNDPQNSLGGWSGSDNTRFQIDCWGKSHADVCKVAGAVRIAMAASSVFFSGVCIADFDGPPGPQVEAYRRIVEFSLFTS